VGKGIHLLAQSLILLLLSDVDGLEREELIIDPEKFYLLVTFHAFSENLFCF
jgi:hypothetical protein